LTKVAAMYGRNNLLRIILKGLTIPSKTGPMKKTQKKIRTSLKDVLIGWFNKPKEAESISTTKAPVKARNKAEKTVNSKSTAKLKEKLKAESLARAEAEKRLKAEIKAREKAEASMKDESKKQQRLEAKAKKVKVEDEAEREEKFRSCAKEVKDCIELINKSSGGTTGKPNRDNKHADMDNNIESKDGRDARKHKATGGKDIDKGTKSNKHGVSPAEMVMLVAKAEENLSKAVIKAKEKDDKKAKRAK